MTEEVQTIKRNYIIKEFSKYSPVFKSIQNKEY